MSRRFTLVTVALVAAVSFLVGVIVAGALTRPMVAARVRPVAAQAPTAPAPARYGEATPQVGALVDFADVVERVNPAVVNIDAASHGAEHVPRQRRGRGLERGSPFDPTTRDDPEGPRRGTGSGFIIDADGSILTNHHLVDRADRINVRLADGRSLRARVIGSDPDIDVALIKVDGQQDLPVAPLGDSSRLRMGEWVCAIGNPLGYEHTVTVGVVSHLGRKLFNPSLDNYIQTDAAISFGNSGGPLINARGEVIGINSAISSRGSNIGFAVPISPAAAILPQLRARGHVSRGYIGVSLRRLDADLVQSLGLPTSDGALVQDVTPDTPAARAGLRPYDVVVSFDAAPISSDEQLIVAIASHQPGAAVPLGVLRDGRRIQVAVKLAERPVRGRRVGGDNASRDAPGTSSRGSSETPALGFSVRALDPSTARRLDLPNATRGVLIVHVEPLSAAAEAGLERGQVLLEINRRPVDSAEGFERVARAAGPGKVVTLFLYAPELGQHQVKAVRIEAQ